MERNCGEKWRNTILECCCFCCFFFAFFGNKKAFLFPKNISEKWDNMEERMLAPINVLLRSPKDTIADVVINVCSSRRFRDHKNFLNLLQILFVVLKQLKFTRNFIQKPFPMKDNFQKFNNFCEKYFPEIFDLQRFYLSSFLC